MPGEPILSSENVREIAMATTSLVRLLARLAAVCALLLLLAAPAMAQSQFRCHDDADRLHCGARIQAAAKPLLDRGAVVAVLKTWRDAAMSGADFRARLRDDRLMTGEAVEGGLVAIDVKHSLDPRCRAARRLLECGAAAGRQYFDDSHIQAGAGIGGRKVYRRLYRYARCNRGLYRLPRSQAAIRRRSRRQALVLLAAIACH